MRTTRKTLLGPPPSHRAGRSPTQAEDTTASFATTRPPTRAQLTPRRQAARLAIAALILLATLAAGLAVSALLFALLPAATSATTYITNAGEDGDAGDVGGHPNRPHRAADNSPSGITADLAATTGDSAALAAPGDTDPTTVTHHRPRNTTAMTTTATLSDTTRTTPAATPSHGNYINTTPTLSCPLGTHADAASTTIPKQPTATSSTTPPPSPTPITAPLPAPPTPSPSAPSTPDPAVGGNGGNGGNVYRHGQAGTVTHDGETPPGSLPYHVDNSNHHINGSPGTDNLDDQNGNDTRTTTSC